MVELKNKCILEKVIMGDKWNKIQIMLIINIIYRIRQWL